MQTEFPNFTPIDVYNSDSIYEYSNRNSNRNTKTDELTQLIIKILNYFEKNNIPPTNRNIKACVESEKVDIHLSPERFNQICCYIKQIIKDKTYIDDLVSGKYTVLTIYRQLLKDKEEMRKNSIAKKQIT